MRPKLRLDALLLARGLAPSREKARARILAGEVFVAGQRAEKPGLAVAQDAEVSLSGKGPSYVSRGGVKLESAWEAFRFAVASRVCLDVGASTGGFTHFLLDRGAAKVYAVDVGYGQLAWELRTNRRVVVLERTNARDLGGAQVPEPIDLAVVDVSFISVAKVLPAVAALLTAQGEAVVLVKPQFEAGRGDVGKRGVVRDPAVQARVLAENAARAPAWNLSVRGATYSKLRGPEGNIEFFLWMARGAEPVGFDAFEVVARARAYFGLA